MTLPLLVFIGSPYLEAQQGNYYTVFPTPRKHIKTQLYTCLQIIKHWKMRRIIKMLYPSRGSAIQPVISFHYFLNLGKY